MNGLNYKEKKRQTLRTKLTKIMNYKILKALIILLLASFSGIPSADIFSQQKDKPEITQPKNKKGDRKPRKHKRHKKHKRWHKHHKHHRHWRM
jgi:hypothetical protein